MIQFDQRLHNYVPITMKKTTRNIPVRAKSRIFRYVYRLNFLGLSVALVFFCFSVLPSLLPRPWLYQSLISGISIAIGYGIGVLLSAAIRWTFQYELPRTVKQKGWKLLGIFGPLVFIIYSYLGSIWQNEVHRLVGADLPQGRHFLRIFFFTLAISWILITIARIIRRFHGYTVAKLDHFMPRRVSIGLGATIVCIFIWWLLSGVFFNFFVSQSNKAYKNRNNSTPVGITQPSSTLRSGSPQSIIPWSTIGFQGQKFVGSGPSMQDLKDFNGTEPKEPIRIYAGINSANNPTTRAHLVIQELHRTGAFNRKILILATPTGTGWLEPQSIDSIEFMHNGDTAIVTQQYSYLPSWISFLVDKDNARDAGRALFDAVYAEWSQLPADSRPKLITYGLSLGSFGGQAAFSGVNHLRLAVDGALFVGTPNDTLLWRDVTAQRDHGTPEWQPTYQEGKAVRFAANNDNINSPQESWQKPRLLYLQHASDPVVWFSFDLLLQKPDWLNEKRGYDVSPTMRWYPFVTFFQVAIDQFFGTSVPSGHGHNYSNTVVSAWRAIAPPEDWNNHKTKILQENIDSYAID